jgi:hypothetical protein
MSPALVLSLIMAIFLGSLCHLIAGRRIWQWPLFVAASIIGFFGGFLAGVTWSAEWLRVGDVPLLVSVAGALVAMWLAWFFSGPRAAAATTPGSNG